MPHGVWAGPTYTPCTRSIHLIGVRVSVAFLTSEYKFVADRIRGIQSADKVETRHLAILLMLSGKNLKKLGCYHFHIFYIG